MSAMTFTMQAQEVIDALSIAAKGLNGTILESLNTSAMAVAQVMRFKAPVGVNGHLADSIVPVVDEAALTAEIKPAVSYADAVEVGSKPHMPPIEPLQAWADMHGMNVWALAMSIKKKGTQPHPFIKPTYDETYEEVPTIFNTGVESFLRGLAA